MKSVTNSWPTSNGTRVSPAVNAAIQTIVQVKLPSRDDAQNVKVKNRRRPALFSTTVNFQSAKLFILPIMYARGRKMFLPMNMPDDCR